MYSLIYNVLYYSALISLYLIYISLFFTCIALLILFLIGDIELTIGAFLITILVTMGATYGLKRTIEWFKRQYKTKKQLNSHLEEAKLNFDKSKLELHEFKNLVYECEEYQIKIGLWESLTRNVSEDNLELLRLYKEKKRLKEIKAKRKIEEEKKRQELQIIEDKRRIKEEQDKLKQEFMEKHAHLSNMDDIYKSFLKKKVYLDMHFNYVRKIKGVPYDEKRNVKKSGETLTYKFERFKTKRGTDKYRMEISFKDGFVEKFKDLN